MALRQANAQQSSLMRGNVTSSFTPTQAASYSLARNYQTAQQDDTQQTATQDVASGLARSSSDGNGPGVSSDNGSIGFGGGVDTSIGSSALSTGLSSAIKAGLLGGIGVATSGVSAPLSSIASALGLGMAKSGILGMIGSGLSRAATGVYDAITGSSEYDPMSSLGSGYMGSGWGGELGGGFTPHDPFMDTLGIVGTPTSETKINSGRYKGFTVGDLPSLMGNSFSNSKTGYGEYGGYSSDAMSAAASQADAQAAENDAQQSAPVGTTEGLYGGGGYNWGGSTDGGSSGGSGSSGTGGSSSDGGRAGNAGTSDSSGGMGGY